MSPSERICYVVCLIPKGKVLPYGKVADLAGLPGRARYVSRALRLSPPSQQIPWHRVINSQGKISFDTNSNQYREQVELLRLDGVIVNTGKISISKFQWQPDIATLVMSLPF